MKKQAIAYWIEQEREEQYAEVEELLKAAFMELTDGDPTEHILVNRLRKGETFIPQLSLVARNDQQILGHIMLTTIRIVGRDKECLSLAMAPVAVRSNVQGMGIGSTLIDEAIQRAKELGFGSIIVLGHPEYYPRFGFRPTKEWEIRVSFDDIPVEYLMGLELEAGALDTCRMGLIEYPSVFFESE